MSLFGCYGQKTGSTAGGPLFPDGCKQAVTQEPASPTFGCMSPKSPVFGCTASSEEVLCRPIEAPIVSMDGVCRKFSLDMSAEQFGMCKCGFDRNAHEKQKEASKGVSLEMKAPTVATTVPAPVATKRPPAVPTAKGKSKGKGKAATGIGNAELGDKEPSKKNEPACQKSFDAIGRLQTVIQGAGFSPLPSDAGTDAAKHVGELPEVLISALLSIMDATSVISGKTDYGSRLSIASVDSMSSIEDPISRMDSKVPVAVRHESKFSSTSQAPAAPQNIPACDTEAAPCNDFQLDLTSSQFGMCRCGFNRAAHSSLGKVNQTMPRGRDTTTREVPSTEIRYSSAPPPPSSEDTPAESGITSASARFGRTSDTQEVSKSIPNQCGPCGVFQLDMSSAQFGMCQCGFDRNAHKQQKHVGETDLGISSSAASRTYTLDQLRNRKNAGNFDGLDASRLEDYLEEREFLKAFGMFVEDFYKLPVWKQKQAKQKAGLF